MKLYKATIENFRQYYGKICLEFSTTERNITIIQGDNGGGKSNLMNAIVWCLFDDEMFKSTKNVGRPVINETALSSLKGKETTTVSVSVVMGDEKPEYEFVRNVEYCKTASGSPERIGTEFKCYHITSTGHNKIPNPEWEVNNRFIPKDLRTFFFFDGEKMDQYFEDTSSVKNNVERISQIDVLNGVIDTINATIKSITRDMGKLSPKGEEFAKNLENLQDERKSLNDELERLVPEIEELKDIKFSIDSYLQNHSSNVVKEKSRRRDELIDQIKVIDEKIDSLNNKMKRYVSDAIPSVFAYNALVYASDLINEETSKGTLPPNVKDVFLKELLESGICICGRSLDEGESCRKNIQSLLDRIVPSDIANDATQGKYAIKSLISNIDFRSDLKSDMQEQIELEESKKNLSHTVSAISEELANSDIFEISKKEEDRRSIDEKISSKTQRIGYIKGSLSRIDRDISNTQDLLNQSNRDDQKYTYLYNQKECARNLLQKFQNIKQEILNEVRSRLEEKTREYFFNMIWKKSSFQDVQIIDLGSKYKISVLSPEGAECLGDISAGERQVLALSFTAALYSVSGYSVPVIIDTPFGRISGTTRDNIASSLPNYLSETQIIMTMTDTEYTDSVRESMKAAVGKEWRIQYDEKTRTSKVVEI